MTDFPEQALLQLSVPDLTAKLTGLNGNTLLALLVAEQGASARKGAIAAIEAAIAAQDGSLAPPGGDQTALPSSPDLVALGTLLLALIQIGRALHLPVESAALIVHEANRIWCELNGDFSQPRWVDAPAWQQESAIAGVRFHLANPDAADSASHDAWMAHKTADGWVYGEVKDPDAKTHPCLVPFDQLPPMQQFKDGLFRTIVHLLSIAPDAAVGEGDNEAEVVDTLMFTTASPRDDALIDTVRAAPCWLVFGDGAGELTRLRRIRLEAENWVRDGDRALLIRAITTSGDAPPVTIRTLALVDEDNDVLSVIEVPMGLLVGGGRKGEFGARSLAF